MKLRNKKTGEITNLSKIYDEYNTFEELIEDWEDYEEPKELDSVIEWINKGLIEEKLPIEVNDIQEKLKAWKRLRDKGVSFKLNHIASTGYLIIEVKISNPGVTFDETDEAFKDLVLLFGGEDAR